MGRGLLRPMTDSQNVTDARKALTDKFGSLWQAAYQMRLPYSGGQLLIEMRKEPCDAVVALMVHEHTGVQLNPKV